MAASRTFDQSKAWDNPGSTKIEIAHLTITSPNDPKIYEQLCVQHDIIMPLSQARESEIDDMYDSAALDSLLSEENPLDQWNAASLNNILESLVANPETRSNFRQYLQSGPERIEATLVRELLLEGLKQSSSLPELNPLHDVMGGIQIRPNVSLVSLLNGAEFVDGEEAISFEGQDDQLNFYAEFMEKTASE